jgi:hypothetical protein
MLHAFDIIFSKIHIRMAHIKETEGLQLFDFLEHYY